MSKLKKKEYISIDNNFELFICLYLGCLKKWLWLIRISLKFIIKLQVKSYYENNINFK